MNKNPYGPHDNLQTLRTVTWEFVNIHSITDQWSVPVVQANAPNCEEIKGLSERRMN